MILIGDVYPKLQTPKKVIRWISEKSGFRGPFNKQHGKWAQTLLQPGRRPLYDIYWSLWKYCSWKKPILVLCKILTLFVNTLTADDIYFLLNKDKLTQPFQILLSQKQKTFSHFSSAFLKSRFKFWTFSKKDDSHSQWIFETTDSKKGY